MENDIVINEEEGWSDPNKGSMDKGIAPKVRVMPKPVLEDKDRVTINFTLTHEHCCVDPVHLSLSCFYYPKQIEQPYQRRIKLTQEWVPLNAAWLQEIAGVVVIRNMTGGSKGVLPTDEQKAEMAKAIVTVCPKGTDPEKTGRRIRPGHFDFCEPVNISEWVMRCEHGTAEVVLDVMPR